MARFEGKTTEAGFFEDPQEIRKDLDPPKVTYRYAQKQAMERADAPTYFMRKTTTTHRKRGTKR